MQHYIDSKEPALAYLTTPLYTNPNHVEVSHTLAHAHITAYLIAPSPSTLTHLEKAAVYLNNLVSLPTFLNKEPTLLTEAQSAGIYHVLMKVNYRLYTHIKEIQYLLAAIDAGHLAYRAAHPTRIEGVWGFIVCLLQLGEYYDEKGRKEFKPSISHPGMEDRHTGDNLLAGLVHNLDRWRQTDKVLSHPGIPGRWSSRVAQRLFGYYRQFPDVVVDMLDTPPSETVVRLAVRWQRQGVTRAGEAERVLAKARLARMLVAWYVRVRDEALETEALGLLREVQSVIRKLPQSDKRVVRRTVAGTHAALFSPLLPATIPTLQHAMEVQYHLLRDATSPSITPDPSLLADVVILQSYVLEYLLTDSRAKHEDMWVRIILNGTVEHLSRRWYEQKGPIWTGVNVLGAALDKYADGETGAALELTDSALAALGGEQDNEAEVGTQTRYHVHRLRARLLPPSLGARDSAEMALKAVRAQSWVVNSPWSLEAKSYADLAEALVSAKCDSCLGSDGCICAINEAIKLQRTAVEMSHAHRLEHVYHSYVLAKYLLLSQGGAQTLADAVGMLKSACVDRADKFLDKEVRVGMRVAYAQALMRLWGVNREREGEWRGAVVQAREVVVEGVEIGDCNGAAGEMLERIDGILRGDGERA